MKKLLRTFVFFQRSKKGGYNRLIVSLTLATVTPIVQFIGAPYYYSQFVNRLENQVVNHELNWQNALLTGIVAYALMVLLGHIVQTLSLHAITHIESDTMETIDNATARHILELSPDFFKDNFTGSLVSKQKEFSSQYETLYDNICGQIIPTIVVIMFCIPIIFGYSWILGVSLLCYSALFFAVSVGLSNRVKSSQEKYTRARSTHSGIISDQISNIQTIKLFGSEEEEIERYESFNREKASLRLNTWLKDMTQRYLCDGLKTLMDVGMIIACYYLWTKGLLQIGGIVLIMSYTTRISDRMTNISFVLKIFRKLEADSLEMIEILNERQTVVDVSDPLECNISAGHIRVNNITFTYAGNEQPIFHDFSLEIPAGQKVGIVGKSGSGKSTLMHLLMRMMDVQEGNITIDTIPIDKVRQKDLRKRMSIVPQDTILFHRTIKKNICYDKQDATMDEIIVAAQKAHAHEFITNLSSHGRTDYHVKVGERGIKLSGGQRQRIGLARAFLQHKPVLILDEATSSLDSHSEKEIQKGLENLLHEQGTMIIIAHRLSTVHRLDRIIVMDHGQIIEDGKPDELYKNPEGAYRKLVDAQQLITE